ncbi:hypothetical protein BDA96_02G129100 [Sorghum bicolor]|uniref:Uncharacterized protein n=2 Tax=Sorghum bicolor TaxID=4558 RepID=A0A1B6QAU8_SORBI|nr:hypothetical protein BDA96_02G129100 [Sorghum bicolor]KXG35021.1 hypothetical protein SORBI_3002G122800 [Sorghum bicolor]OQU88924.1 hypothetical protein SORBI_3002G122800 [Sorghum bicolor]
MGSKQKQRAGEEMSWISRKLFLYNVTIGLYVMDWWERYLFNSIVLILLWLICYSTTKSMWQAFDNHLKSNMQLGTRNYSIVAMS